MVAVIGRGDTVSDKTALLMNYGLRLNRFLGYKDTTMKSKEFKR